MVGSTEVGKIISNLLENRACHCLKYNLLHGFRGGFKSMISKLNHKV